MHNITNLFLSSVCILSLLLKFLIIVSILDDSSLLSFYSSNQQDDYANVSTSPTYVTLDNPNSERLSEENLVAKEDAAGQYEVLVTLEEAAENEQPIYVKPFN